jgi:hypothetical protein
MTGAAETPSPNSLDTRLEAAVTGSQDGCRYVVSARFQRASAGGIFAASRYSVPLRPTWRENEEKYCQFCQAVIRSIPRKAENQNL